MSNKKFTNGVNLLKSSSNIVEKIIGVANSISDIKDKIKGEKNKNNDSDLSDIDSDSDSDNDNEIIDEYSQLENVYIKEAIALNDAANLRIKESNTLDKLANIKVTLNELSNINMNIKQKKEELDEAYFKKKFNSVGEIGNELDRLYKKKKILEETQKYFNENFDKQNNDNDSIDQNNDDSIDQNNDDSIDQNIDDSIDQNNDDSIDQNYNYADLKKKDNEYLIKNFKIDKKQKQKQKQKQKILINFESSKISDTTLNLNIKNIKFFDNNNLDNKLNFNSLIKKIESIENLEGKIYLKNYKEIFTIKDCIPFYATNKILFNINSKINKNIDEIHSGLIKLMI